jgi:hypothetical protein
MEHDLYRDDDGVDNGEDDGAEEKNDEEYLAAIALARQEIAFQLIVERFADADRHLRVHDADADADADSDVRDGQSESSHQDGRMNASDELHGLSARARQRAVRAHERAQRAKLRNLLLGFERSVPVHVRLVQLMTVKLMQYSKAAAVLLLEFIGLPYLVGWMAEFSMACLLADAQTNTQRMWRMLTLNGALLHWAMGFLFLWIVFAFISQVRGPAIAFFIFPKSNLFILRLFPMRCRFSLTVASPRQARHLISLPSLSRRP